MVDLTGASPNPPQADQNFSIEATGGSSPFIFRWQIDEQGVHQVNQISNKLQIKLPAGCEGEIITVHVRDGTGNTDSETLNIAS